MSQKPCHVDGANYFNKSSSRIRYTIHITFMIVWEKLATAPLATEAMNQIFGRYVCVAHVSLDYWPVEYAVGMRNYRARRL